MHERSFVACQRYRRFHPVSYAENALSEQHRFGNVIVYSEPPRRVRFSERDNGPSKLGNIASNKSLMRLHKKSEQAQTASSIRVRSLFRACRSELDKLQGRQLTYQELGRYAGQAPSTIFNRLETTRHPQVEALLRWLERLPKEVRGKLLQDVCREHPTLEHHRLAHDPILSSRLRDLLREPQGLVLITGGDEAIRTFVITALGHSSAMLEPDHRPVVGIDRYRPDWFVPVDGVHYLCDRVSPTVTNPLASIEPGEREILLINGMLGTSPEVLKRCADLSRDHLVLIADAEESLPGKSHVDLPVGTRRICLSMGLSDRVNARFEPVGY